MIATFLLTFAVLALVIGAMAIGVIFRNQPIAGSCGGIGAVPGMSAQNCTCKKPCAKRLQALGADVQSRVGDESGTEPLTFHRRER